MKKILAWCLATVLLLGLTACSGGKNETETVEIGAKLSISKTADVFEEGTEVTAEAVTEGTVYTRAETALKDTAKQIAVYELSAVKDNAKVQPNGKLAVTFPLPAAFSENVRVYYVAEDGTKEALSTTVDADARTATAELSHFSTYVLADLGEESSANAPQVTGTSEADSPAPSANDGGNTTTTKKPTDTTSKKAPTTTTTTKATTTTTTTKPTTTTTTTKAALSPFVNSAWRYATIEESGSFYQWVLIPAEDSWTYGGGSTLLKYFDNDTAMMEKYRDEVADSIVMVNGVECYAGFGDGGPATYTENGTTITVTDENGNQIVLTRVNETTVKVVSTNSTIVELKVGQTLEKQ